MDSDLQFHHQPYSQQQQRVTSGLTRYRSAPSSYFASLLNSSVGDEFLNPRPSSPDIDRILGKFISGGGAEGSSSQNLCGIGQSSSTNQALRSQFMASTKHEPGIFQHDRQQTPEQQHCDYSSAPQIIFPNQTPTQPGLPNRKPAASTPRPNNSNLPQMKICVGGNSNLTRHNSLPAGLLSHVNIEHGSGVMRGTGNLGGVNSTNAVAPFTSPNRLKCQMDFSSGRPSSSGRMATILENGSKSIEMSGPEDGSFGEGEGSDCGYLNDFTVGSWDDSAILPDSILKRFDDDDDEKKAFRGTNATDSQNAEGGNFPPTILSHHLSLPTSSAEFSAVEKLLQDSVPCNVRAKRGCATHPRSIAERVRRTRISERMRKLHELVPNMDKKTNSAEMLDLAVDYIKELQKQLKILSDSKAKCVCSQQSL
ncbi:hypothetical protein NMG60_11033770 [Bertholletia excelsa]